MKNNPALPFVDVVAATRPWLVLRTVGGILMGLGHVVFALLFVEMIWRAGPRRQEEPWGAAA